VARPTLWGEGGVNNPEGAASLILKLIRSRTILFRGEAAPLCAARKIVVYDPAQSVRVTIRSQRVPLEASFLYAKSKDLILDNIADARAS
jgi:hypothetical protein